MQVISIIDSILEPRPRVKTTEYKTLIEFLLDEYPEGFGNMPTVIYEDFTVISVEDYDLEFKPDTAYTIAHQPAVGEAIVAAVGIFGSGFFATVVAAAIDFAVLYAVNYALTRVFAPNLPAGVSGSDLKSDGQSSSVYNLNSNQNSIRLGQPIPILYGRTRSYPSIIEEPYYRFKDNEMYLYQMMVVTAGKGTITELLVGDSKESDLGPSDVLYKTYQDTMFTAGAIKADISSTFGDDDYHMRVKTLPEVSGIELRGTPGASAMFAKFYDDKIEFLPYPGNTYPDLSSLTAGSTITITNSDANNGAYILTDMNQTTHIATVGGTTFVTEPAAPSSVTGLAAIPSIYPSYMTFPAPNTLYNSAIVGKYYNISYGTNLFYNYKLIDKQEPDPDTGAGGYYLIFDHNMVATGTTSITMEIESSYISAEFATSYGAYTLNAITAGIDSIEVDIEFPRGIYNSDASGNFINRSIELQYQLIGSYADIWRNLADPTNTTLITETAKTNTPIRRTYKLPIPIDFDGNSPLKILLKRVSAEAIDIKGQDQAIASRIKTIYDEPDISEYGDITLLWARIKATNAISSKGQFQLNAWVTRTDVLPDITSVIKDLYTNTSYGAKLPATDLQLPGMYVEGTTIDPATDSGAVQTVSEYYIKDEIYNDTGLVLTATEYYIFHPTAAFLDYFIYWDGVIVYSSGFELSVGVEYTTGDGWYYVIDQASPVEETHYSVRRYNKYALPYSVYWGGVLVYSSASLLSVGVPYLSGVDNYYYQVYDEAPAEDTQYPIRRFKYLSSEYYEEFNGAIDARITVMDAISMIATAGRFTAYLDGRNIKIRKDEPQLVRTSLFNETNIIKDSFKLSYLFGESDSTDGVLVKYRSPDDFTEQQKTYPLTSTNPETMELIGCTDPVLADMAAQYGWKSKQARKKIVSFKSDEQALIPNYLDRIGVSHNVPKWGQGGQIIGFSGQDIFLDDNYLATYSPAMPCEPYLVCSDVMFPECVAPTDIPLSIIFRAPNGAVSDIYPCTRTSSSSVSVTGVLPIWMYAGEDYDKTYFSIGETINIIRDFTVTEIKPSGENQYEITGINYDPSIYIYE